MLELWNTNINVKTGIRYGVISQHSINLDALADIDCVYPECECEDQDNCTCYDCEPAGLELIDSEYHVIDCLDTDLMILESPYYTFARLCSPCVPNAGNCDNYDNMGVKCYCLGVDWFDDNKPPYAVYKVSDNTCVYMLD